MLQARSSARCGAALNPHCPKCGTENPPEASFCGDCGATLGVNTRAVQSLEAASTAPDIRITPEQNDASLAVDGERKPVTALFADIKALWS
jgi:hypothetical protein